MAKAKIQYPTFMVFAEAVPDAARLADSKTPPNERARIRDRVNWAMDAARSAADRNTQQLRHAPAIRLRNSVMRDLRCDARGKPLRGEPQRLADKNPGVTVHRIQKWIEQLRRQRAGGIALPDDWRTVYYGEAVLNQTREAGRRRHKKSRG